MATSNNPTYGDLIDIFERHEGEKHATELIFSEVRRRYPCVSVSRPTRFFDTVRRIVGPTRPSLRGTAKLTGSPLASYRRRVWEPRIRNTSRMVNSTGLMLEKCRQVDELNTECASLRKKMESSRQALRDITNEKQHLDAKCELSKAKLAKLREKNKQLEQECLELTVANFDLQSENDSDTSFEAVDSDSETKFQDIIGHRKYSPEIRKLYYSLLADQVPASKIASVIHTVLKCFHPNLNVEKLKLPQKTAASYMHKDELKTLSEAHKAHILSRSDGIF